MTIPKCPVSTLELLPCDNYWPVTIFWPCPEAVIISDNYCTLQPAYNVEEYKVTSGMRSIGTRYATWVPILIRPACLYGQLSLAESVCLY